jgi:outer membrane immunogenic protein
MRRTVAILAAGLSACLAPAALAADMPLAPPPPVVIPVYSWTGCYIGANVGGHWGSDKITTTSSPNNGAFFGPDRAGYFDSLTPTTYHPQGVAGGVQGGCKLQAGNFVAGFEADADWLSGTFARTVVAPANPVFLPAGTFLSNETKATFLGTVRARVGVAVNRMLLFVTGGAAFGTVNTTDSLGTIFGIATTSTTAKRIGWTVGGGIESALTDNWLLRAEYLYVDLGKFDAAMQCTAFFCPDPADSVVHHKYTDHIVRAGISYKFGGPVYAKY